MVDFCQLVDFYVVMMTSLLCTRKMTSLLLQENSDFQLVISYTVFLVHDNACRFILKNLSKIDWTESLSSTCQDVSSVDDAGGRFEPRTSCCWPRNCDSTVAKGVPSRQLVDLQFGLVDTHSADWEPPTCCLLPRRGLRVSGVRGPLRNVPPRRRVERIGTQ